MITLKIISFLIVFIILGCNTDSYNEIYLIPKDYIGVVTIIYDSTSNNKLEIIDNNMTFVIPQSEQPIIGNTHNEGFHNEFYYYVDGNSNKTSLKVNYDFKDNLDSNTVMIWGLTSGTSEKLMPDGNYKKIIFDQFIVSDLKRLDSLLELRDKF